MYERMFFRNKGCKWVGCREERSFFRLEVGRNASNRNALNANVIPRLGCIQEQKSAAKKNKISF